MKHYCSNCKRYKKTELYGRVFLYEGCGKCGLNIKHSVMSGDRYNYETYLHENIWKIFRGAMRLYDSIFNKDFIYPSKNLRIIFLFGMLMFSSCSKYINNYKARVVSYRTDFFNTEMTIQDLKTDKIMTIPVDFALIRQGNHVLRNGDTVVIPFIRKTILRN